MAQPTSGNNLLWVSAAAGQLSATGAAGTKQQYGSKRTAGNTRRGPDDLCFLHGCRGEWETMDPSPPTDRQYINFNSVFLYKAGTYVTGTKHQKIPM